MYQKWVTDSNSMRYLRSLVIQVIESYTEYLMSQRMHPPLRVKWLTDHQYWVSIAIYVWNLRFRGMSLMWIRYVYLFYFVPNKNLEHFIDLKLSVMYISVTNFWFTPTLWSFEDIYIFPMNLDIDILLWTLSKICRKK